MNSLLSGRARGPLKALLVATALAVPLFLSGCSAKQAYGTAQAWQRNQCNKLPDMAEFDRCMRETQTPYESYKRQRDSELE